MGPGVSTRPKDVLELGRAIVDQLGIEHRSDTVDRWMAHHLAELIDAAETLEGQAKREAEDRAVELVLKLWANRRVLPAAADPLSGYRDATKVLAAMLPPADPWRRFRQGNATERLLHDMFGAMAQLVMSGLLLTHGLELRNILDAEWDALSEPERLLVGTLDTWHEFLVTPAQDKTELDSVYRIMIAGEEEGEEQDASTAEVEEDERDPIEIDRAAILSHVETFQARLDDLVTQWREKPAKVDDPDDEVDDD